MSSRTIITSVDQKAGLLWLAMACFVVCGAACGGQLTLEQLEPTPFFPKVAPGQGLRQKALLHLTNSGPAVVLRCRITLGSAVQTEELGEVAPGSCTRPVYIPDLSIPTPLRLELLSQGGDRMLAARELVWQPQKKWKIYCVSYSHHDLGFGNYPHRLRTDIRHANIERPLRFCTETDGWEEDSKFRYVIETSEPLTSFLGSHSEADAAELARRVVEGRIQIGGVHNTANTEQMGHELLARLFYLTGRHSRDLLNLPRSKTAQIDDVIGLTWPLATYCAEAGIPYFFHGHNGVGQCLQPASAEPVFYWQGPDGAGKVLVRSIDYGGYAGDNLGDGSEKQLQALITRFGGHWPYDVLLCQDGTDFQLITLENAQKIRRWNSQYAWPHLVSATMTMFFDEVMRQADPSQLKTFAKDGNNQWADQDATDAWLLAQARRQSEAIPTAEKFSTIAATLAGDGYPWTDLYQAYHRLLQYHEHTDAIDFIDCNPERMRQYETELEENREMVRESKEFSDRACEQALNKLVGLITTRAETNVVIFNPLTRVRTDVVHLGSAELGQNARLKDAMNGEAVPLQRLADGSLCFVAKDVPPLGYKTYSVAPGLPAPAESRPSPAPEVIENRFYRLAFNPTNGAITSIRDKELGVELVDQTAPYQFNEYLYERYESAHATTSKWYRVVSAQRTGSSGSVADIVTSRGSAVGVEKLEQRVILYHDLKRIDFVLDMVKAPSGRTCRLPNASVLNKESVYVALPFGVPDFRFHHELPGAVVEPIRDQFNGSCTAYYAARHFADVANERFGVTVSCPDASLFEYGRPRSCVIPGGLESQFERVMQYPANSRMYLYLMDNMFDVNIRWDQQGPVRFAWSLRSHPGGWQAGKADEFGWEVMNPLVAKVTRGKKQGTLPLTSSFVRVDKPNISCTTLKPAEANGSGFILRFNELQGVATTAKVALPFVGTLTSVNETDLVENDRPVSLPLLHGREFTLSLRPFGVKTVRVLCVPKTAVPAILKGKAAPLTDMQVALSWQVPASAVRRLNHFNVYRGTRPDFAPSLLNRVGQPATPPFIDQPQLHYGGWINNRLEPETTYYYRISAVDRWNNEGPLSPVLTATTFKASEKNMQPLRVEGLRAVLVSPISPQNFVNLLFRTSCESDVCRYEIHRSLEAGFTPDAATRIEFAEAETVIPKAVVYGHVPLDHRAGDYDHMMFQDDTVQPGTTYYYRVCAVDRAGQRGPFSAMASVRTKELVTPLARASASSVYAPEYGPDNAIDGDPDPFAAWISKPYGGGTKDQPREVWWAVDFSARRTLQLKGVKLVGDEREVIPLQKSLQIQVRDGAGWKTVAQLKEATTKTVTLLFSEVVTTDALRVFVPPGELPQSARADVDGIVRICELLFLLPDGRESALGALLQEK
jgi:hypothetical protein